MHTYIHGHGDPAWAQVLRQTRRTLSWSDWLGAVVARGPALLASWARSAVPRRARSRLPPTTRIVSAHPPLRLTHLHPRVLSATEDPQAHEGADGGEVEVDQSA